MANDTYDNKLALNGGYGGRALDRLRTGNTVIMPYLPVIWESAPITFADITDAGTTKELDLNVHNGTGKLFPADVEIIGVQVYLHTTFNGGATSALDLEFGDNGDPNGLITALEIHEDNSAAAGWQTCVHGTQLADQSRQEAAFIPEALFTATGGNLDALTVGLITIRIKCIPLHVPRAA